MDQPISVLIREKLADGRLPHDHFPRIRSGPGNGETLRRLRGDRDKSPDDDGEP